MGGRAKGDGGEASGFALCFTAGQATISRLFIWYGLPFVSTPGREAISVYISGQEKEKRVVVEGNAKNGPRWPLRHPHAPCR